MFLIKQHVYNTKTPEQAGSAKVRKYIAQKGAHRMETEKRNNEENDAGEENRMGRKQQSSSVV